MASLDHRREYIRRIKESAMYLHAFLIICMMIIMTTVGMTGPLVGHGALGTLVTKGLDVGSSQ